MSTSPNSLVKKLAKESYVYFDRYVRELPKNSDGSIDLSDVVTWDNDIDAFRHAFASGVFTHEYGETAAKLAGWLNEKFSVHSQPGDENMDHWNNAVGRRLAMKHKTRDALAKAIKEAMENGELILSPNDDRRYEGATVEQDGAVVVIKESKTGANELFFDIANSVVMTKDEFVAAIEGGNFPSYSIRIVDGGRIPVSKRDDDQGNNLG